MKNYIAFIIGVISICSCASDGPGLAPLNVSYMLLNPDSSSVITSSNEEIIVDYKDNQDGIIRKSYDAGIRSYLRNEPNPWIVKDTMYVLDLGKIHGDSIFITCKEKTDTLVQIHITPLEIIFNGKEIYKPEFDGGIVPLVR